MKLCMRLVPLLLIAATCRAEPPDPVLDALLGGRSGETTQNRYSNPNPIEM